MAGRAGSSLTRILAAAALAAAALARGQGYPEGQIQDNSFLVEEAYNQDPGVVQHIQTFERERGSGDWMYTFTQEWPVPGITHQLSYSIPLQRISDAGGAGKLGDVALNYRYQLVGSGEAAIACAPRATLLLPTGDWRRGYGSGAPGFQALVPLSVVASPRFVVHADAGAGWTPRARNARGERADTTSWALAGSVVWLAGRNVNPLIEVAWTGADEVTGPGRRTRHDDALVSPGIRFAINFASGLQIVPGLACPIGVGPSAGKRSVFLYLSFEHPFRKIER